MKGYLINKEEEYFIKNLHKRKRTEELKKISPQELLAELGWYEE